jgi:hypothetical protein
MSRRTSGRRPLCEHSISIDVREWSRRGFLRASQSFTWFWNFQGAPLGSAVVRTETDAMILTFCSQNPSDNQWTLIEQRVPVTWTKCHLGGQRRWFVCTLYSGGHYCGRRVAVMYGIDGFFACRNCCGLAHASQNESPKNRDIRRSRSIRTRLGGGPNLFAPFPEKPRRMHVRTYLRLRERGEVADAAAFRSLRSSVQRR